jgi:DnaJ homolog subfamily A member 5
MPARRCLYDELSISQTADVAEIKRAYRVAALRWHPDKNRGVDELEASERFKAVQHAYEVLLDPHERAWYDSHRESFIAGRSTEQGADGDASASQASTLDLFSYFNASAYNGFDDSPESFYGVYGMVFSTLAAEERSAGFSFAPPSFGNMVSDWDEVRRFYDFFEGFASRKSFAFADKWNMAEAPNRDYRRAMERENTRARSKVKKEFNSLVRELAAFVKKRDPRVSARKVAQAESKDLREKATKAREAQDAKDRKARAADSRAQRDAVLDEDAEDLDRILEQLQLDEELDGKKSRTRGKRALDDASASGDSDYSCDSDSEVDGCPWEERGTASAVHPKATRRAKETDTSELEGSTTGRGDGAGDYEGPFELFDEIEEDLYCIACKKIFRTAGQKQNHEQSRKHIAAAKKLRIQFLGDESLFAGKKYEASQNLNCGDAELSRDGQLRSQPKKRDKKAARQQIQAKGALARGSNDDAESDDNADVDDDESTARGATEHVLGDAPMAEAEAVPPEEQPPDTETDKAKRVRRRRQKSSAAAPSKKNNQVEAEQEVLRCNVCKARFASRNKLFAHVKNKGHALRG